MVRKGRESRLQVGDVAVVLALLAVVLAVVLA